MHTDMKRIYCTTQEILECKGNEKNLKSFLKVVEQSGWLNKWSYTLSRTLYKASQDEFRGWLQQGLWESIEKAWDNIIISNLLILGRNRSMGYCKERYYNSEFRGDELCDAMEKDCDGNLEEIQIPYTDPQYLDIEIREFLAKAERTLEPREMYIVRAFAQDGEETNLRELGEQLGISHERVRQLLMKAQKKMKHQRVLEAIQ